MMKEQLRGLYRLPGVVRTVRLMGRTKNACRSLVEKPLGVRQLERPR
jgi:hypothetical protein